MNGVSPPKGVADPRGVSVPKGATIKLGRVEGDLKVGTHARVEAESGEIQVSGRVVCEGDAEFVGGLTCSEFNAMRSWGWAGKIKVSGDLKAQREINVGDGQLVVTGSIEATEISVDKILWIGGNARADSFDVGGKLEVSGTISGKKVDVGGQFKVQGAVEVDEVDVGGIVEIDGHAKCAKMDVGGLARIGGGEVSKDVDVGGKFESTRRLKFSKLDVGGEATLDEGGEGGDVDVGGRFESRADLSFNTIDVGGSVSIDGNGSGVKVDVGGLLRVSGNLTLEKNLQIGGKAYVGAELTLESLEIGGSMEAAQIIAQEIIEIGGDLKTITGAKADTVRLRHGSRSQGPIVAREVDVGHGGRVETIYAELVELGHGSRARNLYFRKGTIEAGAHVEGEVRYTDSIDASPECKIRQTPAKGREPTNTSTLESCSPPNGPAWTSTRRSLRR